MWVLLALVSAVSYAAQGASIKSLSGRFSDRGTAWLMLALEWPFTLPVVLIQGVPEVGPDFWWGALLSFSLNFVAVGLYTHAIRISDLSIVFPLLSLTPVFMMLSGFLILGEVPDALGLAGVLLIAAGVYLLGGRLTGEGVLAPIKRLWSDKGARLSLLLAVIWSVSGVADKVAVTNSSPAFYSAAFCIVFTVLYLPIAFRRPREMLDGFRPLTWRLVLPGMFGACASLSQLAAFGMTLVGYVIAVKRTGMFFAILFGALFFNETRAGRRVVPAGLIFLGVSALALATS